jgi:diguanylate cyclase (GGDEF)-like protein
MFILIGIFNLLLMIPDGIMLSGSGRAIGVYIIRSAFSLILFVICIGMKKIRTFGSFSHVVSVCELLALAVFIYVFSCYEQPSLLIQAMGMLIIIIAIFLIPNRWENMLFVSTAGAIGFMVCAYTCMAGIDMVEYWAALVYILLTLVLCAQAAYMTETFQYREFAAKKELERISTTDYLTDTANRYKMNEEANKWISYCRRNKQPLTLAFVDIDDFKTINDCYGHLAGDSVLMDLTRLIRGCLRSSDVISRWGGDEFVLLFPNAALRDAVTVTERIRAAISENTFVRGIRLTCCFGVVEMKEDSDFEKLVMEADDLMYRGKGTEKNRVHYSPEEIPTDPSGPGAVIAAVANHG